jgi:putative Ca2+/H+ antiporter (TMEM165/GDT1 family)
MYEDSWYDYIALPIGPLVLLTQMAAMLLPFRQSRRVVVTGASAAMLAMMVVVLFAGRPSEGANIGAGLLLPQVILSLILAAVEWRFGNSDKSVD